MIIDLSLFYTLSTLAGVKMALGGTLQGISALSTGRRFWNGDPLDSGISTPRPNINLDNTVDSKLNTNGLRTELKAIPKIEDQLSFVKVNTGGENISYVRTTGDLSSVQCSGKNIS